ncbi:hypothetical protein EVAR_29276_1 [Eumeta japonica]|uniref:Uncharacterized protein n=1 Tax=Eumeta variegata TaxID=151549 RepID=A0A4C1VUS0_EUMVA|nr:hypothetical protein EVAR_29276_1 [Eumeta japonica]
MQRQTRVDSGVWLRDPIEFVYLGHLSSIKTEYGFALTYLWRDVSELTNDTALVEFDSNCEATKHTMLIAFLRTDIVRETLPGLVLGSPIVSRGTNFCTGESRALGRPSNPCTVNVRADK